MSKEENIHIILDLSISNDYFSNCSNSCEHGFYLNLTLCYVEWKKNKLKKLPNNI